MTLPAPPPVLSPPFVLLDDARPGGAGARLYTDPVEIVTAYAACEVTGALARLRAARERGLYAAGFLSFEAGAGIEPRMAAPPGEKAAPRGAAQVPLLWFGLFPGFRALAGRDVPALLPDPAGAWAGPPRPTISAATYADRFAIMREAIAAGDIYQANLTFPAHVPVVGHPAALFALLRQRQAAGQGALVATGDRWIVSLSPELFFSLDDGRLTTRPMKGTAPRAAIPAEDRELADALAADPKQRAENLMIVDLLRNDLSRIARPGSVAVPERFVVESYPTVHQMVSTVTAELADGRDAVDVIEALFPCGSITGAPKIRATQILHNVEDAPRGIYTGSIGRIDADGNARFNVAIRTLDLRADGDGGMGPADHRATLGLGSGVVADSQCAAEWQECLAKGAFVTAGETPFDLIETMAFDPESGIDLLERHLARMKDSALTLGFSFDRHAARNELQAATFRLEHAARVRVVLARSGALAIGIAPMPPIPTRPVPVAIRPRTVDAHDFRLSHKTTRRAIYPRDPDTFETLYVDAMGRLTEGSFTSLFVERDGMLLTPPLERGLLPGVLRAELLATGRAVEHDLTPADLAGGFFIGNALRGLIPAVAKGGFAGV